MKFLISIVLNNLIEHQSYNISQYTHRFYQILYSAVIRILKIKNISLVRRIIEKVGMTIIDFFMYHDAIK